MSYRLLPSLLLLAAAGLIGCADGQSAGAVGESSTSLASPAIRRGVFQDRRLLSGELAALESTELVVPRTPSWQVQIRWLIEDGTPVAAGQVVAELDNSQFTSDLEEKRSSAAQSTDELTRAEAESAGATQEKELAVEQKRAELEKARIAADIPEDLLARREYQERQLALRRAETNLAKAQEDLGAQRQGSAADLAVRRVELEKNRREIATAERAIEALVLRAPSAGIALVADHPWEGRKLRLGDSVWVGRPVVSIPDLSSVEVKAELFDVDDGSVRLGMPAVCTLDAYPDRPFTARVTGISALAQEPEDGSSLLRSFTVRLRLDRFDPERMRPGLSVRVEVRPPAQPDALLVPRGALELTARPPRLVLASGESKAVELGPCNAQDCVLRTPLAVGTAVGTALRSVRRAG
jgi:HlyD family secretion protein